MLCDDHPDFEWHFALADTAPETAARSFFDHFAAFDAFKGLMLDDPPHFKAESMRFRSKSLKIPHHFILSYSLWIKSTVKRLGKEIFRVFCVLLSELQLSPEEGQDILLLVKSALNQSTSPP